MKTAIIAILALSSCGAQDSSGGGATTTQDTAKTISTTTQEMSYYVDSVKDLKECDKEHLGALAYVKAQDHFLSCEESGWTEVTIKGKDGANGKDGKDAPIVDASLWVNSVNGKTYKIMGNIWIGPVSSATTWAPLCEAIGFASLSDADAVDAIRGGIQFSFESQFNLNPYMWVIGTAGATANDNSYRRLQVGNSTYASEAASTKTTLNSNKAFVVCVK